MKKVMTKEQFLNGTIYRLKQKEGNNPLHKGSPTYFYNGVDVIEQSRNWDTGEVDPKGDRIWKVFKIGRIQYTYLYGEKSWKHSLKFEDLVEFDEEELKNLRVVEYVGIVYKK
jgi:hypothetical protein